jgi:transposase
MSHSSDLRKKAIAYFENGGSIKDVCIVFGISRSSFLRWRGIKEEKGNVERKARIKAPYKLNNEKLKAYIKKHPDAYLSEMAENFKVTPSCIWVALKRLKITRKKSPRSTKKEMS